VVLEALVTRWRRVIAEQMESGLTQRAFCRERDLPFHRFHYWKHEKLPAIDAREGGDDGRGASLASAPATEFVPVEVVFEPADPPERPSVTSPSLDDSGVEVLLPGGLRVGLRRGFDAHVLQAVVEVLRC
jgi:hypothetical protein